MSPKSFVPQAASLVSQVLMSDKQARSGLREKLREGGGRIPTFGKATGLIVNYSPDHAVEFDLSGNPLRVLERAHRPGKASFPLKGRALPLSRGELAAAFGTR